jgi:regulator of nonsense transcripts 3
MSTTEPATAAALAAKKKTRRSEKRSTHAKANPHERLKTVVRRLPPNLPEDIFWQSVQNWVSEETATWKVYHQGKLRKKYTFPSNASTLVLTHSWRLNKENVHSRAYIAFKNEQLVATFSREYDGHIFRDKAGAYVCHSVQFVISTCVQGNESQAVVEFASYQKVPPLDKKKQDNRAGTIDKGALDVLRSICKLCCSPV